MTGVINAGVRLPAVIFPVVIRPSGGLTSLISLSVSASGGLPPCATQLMSVFSAYLVAFGSNGLGYFFQVTGPTTASVQLHTVLFVGFFALSTSM